MTTDGEHQIRTEAVRIPIDHVTLDGDLAIPAGARGVVLFAHGSGSSRLSPRNRAVASTLHRARFATLLLDLLTQDEERADEATGHLRFDIPLLAARLVAATDWVARRPDVQRLPIGYFGASTGAGAALMAAAERPEAVRAVVSRGGRPDLARGALLRVRAPTLLVVGGRDTPVIAMNRDALDLLHTTKRLEVVPGATHLFEEAGTLEQVAALAADWFAEHLARAATEAGGSVAAS
jgi:dienelactone hydrolase